MAGLTIPPESGSSRPASILSSVVFPAPFGPQRPTRSPSPICHVTWSSRTRSPKDFVRSESWITAGGLSYSQLPTYQDGEPNSQSARKLGGRSIWEVGTRRARRGVSGGDAERLRGGGENLRYLERLREIARDPEIDGFDRA